MSKPPWMVDSLYIFLYTLYFSSYSLVKRQSLSISLSLSPPRGIISKNFPSDAYRHWPELIYRSFHVFQIRTRFLIVCLPLGGRTLPSNEIPIDFPAADTERGKDIFFRDYFVPTLSTCARIYR